MRRHHFYSRQGMQRVSEKNRWKGEDLKTEIKRYRQEKNITQEELASSVGVRRETIVFLEKGKYNPSLKLAYDISKIFGVKIEDIFIFEDEEK